MKKSWRGTMARACMYKNFEKNKKLLQLLVKPVSNVEKFQTPFSYFTIWNQQ